MGRWTEADFRGAARMLLEDPRADLEDTFTMFGNPFIEDSPLRVMVIRGNPDMGPSPAQTFDAMPARQQATNDFIRALGQAKLSDAQAAYNEALASSETARAMILFDLAADLAGALANLNREQAQANTRVHVIAMQAHAANMLLRGTEIAAYNHARDAYRHLEAQALLELDQEAETHLYDDPVGPLAATDFMDNSNPSKPCESPTAANALQLIDWLLTREYVARPGTRAQHAILGLFQRINSVATTAVLQIRQHTGRDPGGDLPDLESGQSCGRVERGRRRRSWGGDAGEADVDHLRCRGGIRPEIS